MKTTKKEVHPIIVQQRNKKIEKKFWNALKEEQ